MGIVSSIDQVFQEFLELLDIWKQVGQVYLTGHQAVKGVFYIDGIKWEGGMPKTIQAGQKVTASISFTDNFGNPAQVEDDPVTAWEASETSLVSITPATDGLSAEILSSGPVGLVQIKATADADLGDGVKTLLVLGDLEIVAAEAVAGTMTFGEAQ